MLKCSLTIKKVHYFFHGCLAHIAPLVRRSALQCAQVDKAALLRGLPVEKIMLPIDSSCDKIIDALKKHQVVIVVGETGSGKTTRLPVFLHEAGFSEKGMIGITEPRRIAATSVARFVADEMNTRLGDLVGYQVRFDNQSHRTDIKFMTDGILLREVQDDPELSKYSVIVVDEAHERSCNIDFTLGLLKDLLKRRQDLKVVVASATIDHQKFSEYFGSAPIVEVSGRVFPVEISYETEPIRFYDDRHRFTMDFMVQAVVNRVAEIHKSSPPGDVLVFMSGKDDINSVITALENMKISDLVALPVYGGLSQEDQDRIFNSFPGQRKVIVATNIAETSITIDGIVYVVDSGVVKQMHFHPESGIQSLDFVSHSKAGCNQRKGRAGRTRPGKCFRMYTERDFAHRDDFTKPEIQCVSLAGVVLAMEDIGIDNIEGFDFIDSPERSAFHEAYETLIALGAIAQGKKGITDLGRQMASLPLEPRIARMVLEADKYGCVKEIATIAAFLSAPHIFNRPKGKEIDAESAHMAFQTEDSDLLRFLFVWRQYEQSGFSDSWCRRNFLNSKSLTEVSKIRKQLFDVLENNGIELSQTDDDELVLKSATAGLVYNLLEQSAMYSFAGLLRRSANNVFVHPGSVLFGQLPKFLVATEIVQTTKQFARNCTKVQLDWLLELLPNLFRSETSLVSVSEDGEYVVAQKKIFMKRHGMFNEIGSEEVEIGLDEARVIQEEQVRTAKAEGWILLTFHERDRSFSNPSLDWRYQTHCFSGVEPGVPYYCKVEEGYNTPGYLRFVDAKLKVLNLPKPVKAVEVKPTATAVPEPGVMTLSLGGRPLQVRV